LPSAPVATTLSQSKSGEGDAVLPIISGNLQQGLPEETLPDEIFDILAERGEFRIERIISTGQIMRPGSWYDQVTDEFVLLVSGAARIKIEGETKERELGPGDWMLLPAHCRHRVTWTQDTPPTIWMAVHF
jgi:cupin 2 domain-containing protein